MAPEQRTEAMAEQSQTEKTLHLSVSERMKYRKVPSTENFHPETLLLLTRHSWNLYRITHLTKVTFEKAALKKYASKIKEELVKHVKDDSANVSFSVSVSKLPGLEKEDPSSLQVEVFVMKENTSVLKYKGVLLSWNNNVSDKYLSQIPFLLCEGTVKVTRIVHQAISELFDTYLRPLRISEDDLMWLSAMLNDSSPTDKDEISYYFTFNDCNLKNPISFSFPSVLLHTLWSKIHPVEHEEVTFDEVYKFHCQIQAQLTIAYQIDCEKLKLNKVVVPDAIIESEGKIKMFREETAIKILSFIKDISIALDSFCPTMSSVD